MTPEERARFCASLFLDPAKVSSEKRARVEREIAVSIREAVKAERIECAKVCERHVLSVDTHQQWGCGYREASNDCAAAIRKRPL